MIDKDENRDVKEFIGTKMKGKTVVDVDEIKVQEGKYILVRRKFHLDSGGYFWKEFYRSKKREQKLTQLKKRSSKISKKGGDSSCDEDTSDEDKPKLKVDTSDVILDDLDIDGDLDFLDGVDDFVQVDAPDVGITIGGTNGYKSKKRQDDGSDDPPPAPPGESDDGSVAKKKKKKGRSKSPGTSKKCLESPRPKVKRTKSKKGGKKKKDEGDDSSTIRRGGKKKKKSLDDEKSTKSSKAKKKGGDKKKKKDKKKKETTLEPAEVSDDGLDQLDFAGGASDDIMNYLDDLENGLLSDSENYESLDDDDDFFEYKDLPVIGDDDPVEVLKDRANHEEAQKPIFMKIMGVWETRKEKVAYSNPMQKMGGGSGATSDNPFESRMERMKGKKDADNPTPKEAAPGKFMNMQAESIDFEKPYKRPVYAKTEEQEEMLSGAVGDNAAFQGLEEDQIKPLMDAFEPKMFKSGTVISKAGAPERFYSIVQSGEVDFFVDGVQVGSAAVGQTFGDAALQGASAQHVSAVAKGEGTVLLQIENNAFRHIVRDEMIKSENEKVKLLKSVDMFKDLDDSDLAQLSEAMVARKFRKGENITRKFKEMPFCIIQKGSVVATDVEVGPGQSFGENALQAVEDQEPAKVSALAKTAGLAFTIDPASFRKVFGDYDRLKRKNEEQKALLTVRSIRDAGLLSSQLQDLVAELEEVRFDPEEIIFIRGEETRPLMYLVREGKVKVKSAKGEEISILPGGFFGTEHMEIVTKGGRAILPEFVVADFSAVASYESVCGILSLQDLAAVTGANMKGPPPKNNIGIKDLDRHRLLGEGQYGQVWLVTDKNVEDPEPLALKIQQLKTSKNFDRTEAIRKETKLMSALQHQFIVRLLNVYKSETEMSMLMSIAPGGELFDVIHRQTDDGFWISGMNEPCAKFYTSVIADTLAYMHKQKYLYRDLKPENILIDKDGYPVLTDFGFAKKLDADKTYTFCGTPNFVAPEVILQRGHDAAADNWSLGVLLFEMIDGDNPFWEEGMDNGTLYDVICHSPHFPLPEHVSVEAEHLISRLLEKNPGKRIGTFREKDILEHEWFDQVDMDDVRAKRVKAPKVPDPIEL